MRHTLYRNALFLLVISAASSLAQSTDVNELKAKLSKLETMMQELRQQIVVLEQSQTTPGQSLVTPEPKTQVPTPLAPSEHIGELTRMREVANENPESAARINNEPMNRALRGYFRLPGTGTLVSQDRRLRED
jgi:hypothetical protein